MPRSNSRKPASNRRGNTTITIEGNQNAVATDNSQAHVLHVENKVTPVDFQAWRQFMEREIDTREHLPQEDKSILKQNIEQIAVEAEKGKKADPRRLERLINAIGAMAPDIFEVAVTTLINPLEGIRLVVRKIGEKAKVTQKA